MDFLDKVSIIIPAYNKANLTKKTILSVVNQTYKNIEIIVINDGSIDNTEQTVKSINDNRINYIYTKNSGACRARNLGIEASSGKFLAFLDCDDTYELNKIEESIKYLKNNISFKFLYTDVNFMDENDNIVGSTPHFPNHPGSGWISKRLLLCDYNLTNSTLVIYKSCINKIGMFDENIFIPADREFIIRLGTKYKGLYVNKNLSNYRIHSESIYSKLDLAFKEFMYMVNKYKDTSLINNNFFYKKCVSNIYYNFAKLYAANHQLKKSKRFLIKSLLTNIFDKKNYKKIIGIFLIIFYPTLIINYFKRFKEY